MILTREQVRTIAQLVESEGIELRVRHEELLVTFRDKRIGAHLEMALHDDGKLRTPQPVGRGLRRVYDRLRGLSP